MFHLRSSILALLTVSALTATLAFGQQAMDDDAVIKMSKAGLSDDLIVQTINAQPGAYTTSPDDLMRLKKEGVSDRVLSAMLGKGSAPAGAASTTPASAPGALNGQVGVDEVGVYYKDKDGKWVEFSPEIVNYKSGGAVKSAFSYGIVKQDRNGHLPGKSSKIVLNRQTDILIYTSEGVSPEEYQLLKLRQNSDNREFRSETGGVFHKSTGAQRDDIPFTTTKISPRMYRLTLAPDLKIGEYGILPPGAISSSNAASAGKMFTFTLPE